MLCIKSSLLCSELSQEIDVLQEIYIDELLIETNLRFYNSLMMIVIIRVLFELFMNVKLISSLNQSCPVISF